MARPRSMALGAALAGLVLLLACQAEQLVDTAPPDHLPSGLDAIAVRVDVDLVHGQVRVVPPQAAPANGAGPDLAILGTNEITATTSNLVRTLQPGNRARVTFDVALTNRLTSASLVPPTFPSTAGGLLLFPFKYSSVVGGVPSQVLTSTDWNGDGSPGSGAPRNFFNDAGCPVTGITSDCLRWEQYAAPLYPGETTPAQNVGFDVPKAITSFSVYLAVAADISNDLPAPQRLVVTPSTYVMNDGFAANFSAVAYDINNQPMPWLTIRWTSPDITAVVFQYGSALVGSITGPSVVVHGRKVGQTFITARTGGLSVTVPIDIQVNTIVLVQPYILPDSVLDVGEVVQAVASVKDNSGNIVPGFNPTWSSSDPNVATVDPVTGLITAIGPGAVTITATAAAASGTIPVTVATPTTGDIAGKMLDTDGQPVQGATVLAVGPSGSVTAITATDGSYTFGRTLLPGGYRVDWAPAGCAGGTNGRPSVVAGQVFTLNITVDCPATVAGTVTLIRGTLPPGLTVDMTPDLGGALLVAPVQTDGSYQINGIGTGGYRIFLDHLTFNCTALVAQSISLTQQARMVVDFSLDCAPVGAITGTVMDLDFGAVNGGTVRASAGGQLFTTLTDNLRGDYTIAGVPTGTALVTASQPGCTAASMNVTVNAGQTATATFALDCPTIAGGNVVEAFGGQIPPGLLVGFSHLPANGTADVFAPVDPLGTYSIALHKPAGQIGAGNSYTVQLTGIPPACILQSGPSQLLNTLQQQHLQVGTFVLDCSPPTLHLLLTDGGSNRLSPQPILGADVLVLTPGRPSAISDQFGVILPVEIGTFDLVAANNAGPSGGLICPFYHPSTTTFHAGVNALTFVEDCLNAGAIEGTIRTAMGNPLPGVHVLVNPYTLITDANGHWGVGGLPTGTQQVLRLDTPANCVSPTPQPHFVSVVQNTTTVDNEVLVCPGF